MIHPIAALAIGLESTPEKMQRYSEGFLNVVKLANPGGVYDSWARAEIARRQFVRLAELISSLNKATDTVKTEVRDLTDSSNQMERLTRSLKVLTIWLMVFAGVQIVIATIQTIKMYEPTSAPPSWFAGEPSPVAADTRRWSTAPVHYFGFTER